MEDIQVGDPLKDLYNEFNPKLKLASSFDEFKSVMSNPSNRKDFYNQFNPQLKLANSFDEFDSVLGLKKKDLGGPISSPTESQSVSKSFISSLPEQKSIYAPSQKLVSESTMVVAPKEAKLISEANKRGDQITKEAIENSNNLYLAKENKGVYKFTKDSPSIQQNKKSLEEDLAGGALQVVKSPKTGKYVLAHNAGIFNSFSNAWDNVLAKQADDKYVAGLSTEDKIKHYEVKDALNQDKYLEEAPSGLPGSFGKVLGENAEPLIKLAAMANVFGKGAQAAGATAQTIANAQKFGSFLAFSTDAGYSGYANNTERVYNSLRQQNPNGNKVEQMRKAENAGLIGEASGIGMAAGMTGIFKNLKGAAEAINTKPFVSAIETMAKHTSKEAGVQGSIAALNSIVSDLGAKSQGMDISTGDIVENAFESGKQMSQFVGVASLAMGTLTGIMKVPGYVKAQAKGLVSELPREEVKAVYEGAEANGIIPEGTTNKVINSLNEYDVAKQKLPEGLSSEHKSALTGIQEKIDKLENSKKNLAPQYHDRIDGTINSLKERAIKIMDSKNPMSEEFDNILNVKGSEEIAGPPVTEVDLIEEVKPKVEAKEKETPLVVEVIEKVTPKEVKVTEEVKPIEIKQPAKELAEGESVTFKTQQGGKLNGEKVVIPGYEDMDMVLVKDGFENKIYELASGLEIGGTKEAFSREAAIESLRKTLEERKITSGKVHNVIFKGENVKQINPSKRFESYAEERTTREKSDYEKLPLKYSPEEIQKLEELKKKSIEFSIDKKTKEIEDAIASRSKEGKFKAPVTYFESLLKTEIDRKIQKESEQSKVPYPKEYIKEYPKVTEDYLKTMVNSGFKGDRFGKIPSDIKKMMIDGLQLSRDFLNKYGYYPYKESDIFFTKLLYFMNSIGARENKDARAIAARKEIISALDNLNKVHEKEFGKEKEDVKVKEEKTFAQKDLDRAEAKRIHGRVAEMEPPSDADQIALRYLADGGKVSQDAINEVSGTTKGPSLNTGRRELKTAEAKARDYAEGNESLNDLAHRLWELNRQKISERDIKDSLMSEIGSQNTRLDASKAYLERYNPEYQAEQYYNRLAEERQEEFLKEQEEIERQLREPLDEQIEGEASEEHINNLIKQYEAEFKTENKQLEPESKGEAVEEAGSRSARKEAPEEKNIEEAYKDLTRNEKRRIINSKFEELLTNEDFYKKFKIKSKCL